jgi:hypothetical protein
VHPEAAEYVKEAVRAMRDRWAEYVERMVEVGWLPPDTDVHAVTTAIVGLVPGFMLQHLIVGDPDPETLARGVAILLPYGEPAVQPVDS